MKFLVFLAALLAVTVAVTQTGPETFVINGGNASHTPHHVIVEFVNAANLGFFGGGSIITSTHVLTAAQNIQGFTLWRVGYGSYRRADLIWIQSTNALAHFQYAPATRNNDIGIITLPTPIVFTARVRPIALPPALLELPFENEQGTIVGFGFTSATVNQPADNLRYGYVRVQSNTFCTSIFHMTVPNHFCASDNRHPVNICNGDIGGGFTVFYRREEVLAGISSMLIENCHIQWPSAYTRVYPYLGWIHQVIGI
ncbi:brachyurin-like [Phlebotomus argentipes]|uniref:brachyurin-like n=1 Tax=Phlebotomus argentipes TaxID=94469 RepID=UPI00289380B2|nr:brachyurin-like [Phlebotomus argentipes]